MNTLIRFYAACFKHSFNIVYVEHVTGSFYYGSNTSLRKNTRQQVEGKRIQLDFLTSLRLILIRQSKS